MDVYVARHAIFDRNLSLYGYELLFRSCNQNRCDTTDDSATLQVLANSLLSSGLETVSGSAPLFINFGRDLLTSHWTSLFPPESVVIEILESVQPDPEVIASCARLHEMGYRLALDDVVGNDRDAELFPVADFVKVDFRLTCRQEQADIAKRLGSSGKKLVAEKVESHEEFLWASQAGYHLFQGFFFARPALLRGRHLPNAKVNALRLLRELQSATLNFEKLEQLIRCDVSLTYKLFRYVNSALFGRNRQICSVKEALMIMGEIDVRRWMTLATIPDLASGRAGELIVHALVRARFCELLAKTAGLRETADCFLIGLFSLLDALVDRPLTEVLSEMALPDRIGLPLLDSSYKSPIGHVFRTALAYQTADWNALQDEVAAIGIAPGRISDEYLQALSWSSEMFSGITCEVPQGIPRSQGGDVSWASLMAMQSSLSRAERRSGAEAKEPAVLLPR